jgi:phosphatidyl-myo-inositol dimannoside synthase
VLALLGTGRSRETPKGFQILDVVTDQLTFASKFSFAAKALGLGPSRYDLTICTFIGLAPVAALMQLLFRTPFWVTCHGVEAWRRLPFTGRLALKMADRVIPISRFTAEKIAEVNEVSRRKITILYNAVPDEFAARLASRNGSPRARHQNNLLSVGMLSKKMSYKGFDTVIRALPKILETVPDLRYTVAGDGDDKERLSRLAAELGVAEYVDFVGEVSDSELAAHYRACDVFVLPSSLSQANGNWQGEGFGRVYVEAALAGKPVVGSRDGGAAEAVSDGRTGLLVDPSSASDVASALINLLQAPDLAARMGREGQRWARENFSVSVLRRQLREMLDGSSTPPQ